MHRPAAIRNLYGVGLASGRKWWTGLIYCVIPETLEDELYDKLTKYYADDPNVEVIVERRKGDRRERGGDSATDEQRVVRDRRRRRAPGSFPKIDAG